MKRYVVACCDVTTGDLEQQVISANTGFDAICEFLGPIPSSVTTEDEVFAWAYDHELFINYIEL